MIYHPGEKVLTKVVGVTYKSRQTTIMTLNAGDEVQLVRDPSNPHDSNAIQVRDLKSREVGYIKAIIAKSLAPLLDAHGKTVDASVAEITGGFEHGTYYGVNVEFCVPEKTDKAETTKQKTS